MKYADSTSFNGKGDRRDDGTKEKETRRHSRKGDNKKHLQYDPSQMRDKFNGTTYVYIIRIYIRQ